MLTRASVRNEHYYMWMTQRSRVNTKDKDYSKETSYIVRIFESSKALNEKIKEAFTYIGTFFDIDSIYVNIYNDDHTRFKRVHEYVKPGIRSMIELFKDTSMVMTDYAVKRLVNQGMFKVLDTEKNDCNDDFILLYRLFGIKSVIGYPLFIGDQLIGAVGFTYNRKRAKFTHDHHKMLKLLSQVISKGYETEYHQVKMNLHSTLYKQVYNQFIYPMVIVNQKNMIVDVNPQFEKVFDKLNYEVVNRPLHTLISQPTQEQLMNEIKQINTKGDCEWFKVIRGTKKIFRIKSFQFIEQGETYTNLIFIDVTQDKIKEKELKKMAYYDSCTGLNNKNYFNQICDEVKEIDYQTLGIMVLDIDNLKQINEELGHEKGDEVIVTLSRMIHEVFNQEYLTARIGGNEFIVLFINRDQTYVSQKLKEIEKEIETYNSEHDVTIELSAGTAITHDKQERIGKLINDADNALYNRKKGKRNPQ